MKRFLILTMLTSAFWLEGNAQRGTNNYAFEVLGGVTKFGTTYSLSFNAYFANKFFVKLRGAYRDEIDRGIPHKLYGANLALGYTILGGADQKFNLAVLAGLVASHETGTFEGVDDKELTNDKAGGMAGVQANYFLSPRWSLVAYGDQSIVGRDTNSVWGYKRWSAMVGVSYHFRSPKMLKKSWCD